MVLIRLLILSLCMALLSCKGVLGPTNKDTIIRAKIMSFKIDTGFRRFHMRYLTPKGQSIYLNSTLDSINIFYDRKLKEGYIDILATMWTYSDKSKGFSRGRPRKNSPWITDDSVAVHLPLEFIPKNY